MQTYTTGLYPWWEIPFYNQTLLPTDDDRPANAETVNSAFRTLSDRTRALMNGLASDRPRVTARSTDNVSIVFEQLGPVPVYDSVNNRWLIFRTPTGSPFDITLTPAGLVGSTWYYVYATQTAGSLTFRVSTTPPDQFLIGENGDLEKRYLLCFYTDAFTAINRFRVSRGRYVWDNPISPGITGNNTFPTNYNLATAGWCPPHVKLVSLRITISEGWGSYDNVALTRPGLINNQFLWVTPFYFGQFNIPDFVTDLSNNITLSVGSAGTTYVIFTSAFQEG